MQARGSVPIIMVLRLAALQVARAQLYVTAKSACFTYITMNNNEVFTHPFSHFFHKRETALLHFENGK